MVITNKIQEQLKLDMLRTKLSFLYQISLNFLGFSVELPQFQMKNLNSLKAEQIE